MIALIDGDVLLHMAIWQCDTLEEAEESFNELLNGTIENMFGVDYVMAFGGPSNFREDIYPEYKKSTSREKSRSNKPEWFDDLKSKITDDSRVVVTEGYEADDQIAMWAWQLEKKGKNYIVVSVDKDLDCIDGRHYNPRTGTFYFMKREDSTKFFYKQLLMGDPVDNIPGAYGIGPKKADKILENSVGVWDHAVRVCKAYDKVYGEKGYENLLTNARLLWLLRAEDDHWKFKEASYEHAIRI